MDDYNFAQPGWQCPICKRVYSPFTPCCFNCGAEDITRTDTTTGGVEHQNKFFGPRTIYEEPNYTSISTGYATYTAEDIRTCDYCKHNAGLPSNNGTMEYSGVCKNCVAKDMWEMKKNDK